MSDQERLTPERLAELREIAEAATPGKRVVFVPEGRRGHEWFILQVDGSVRSVITVINKWARNMSTVDYCDADAEFFAALDPATVLALLDEIERLRRVVEAALDILSREDIGDGAKVEGVGWPTRESERARLVAEVGECCRGADPLCAAGCLVEAALRQRPVDKEGTA